MKKYFIIAFVAAMVAACGNNKKAESNVARDMYDWMGSYTNDTITFILKDKGVCDVVTAKTTLPGCDYSWDVDGNNICIVDADHNIYLLEMHDGYMTSSTGSKFTKIK
jgi:hypothetical protein